MEKNEKNEQIKETEKDKTLDGKKHESKKKLSKDKTMKIKESEYQKLVADLLDYKDKCVRLYADFENTRKRFDREKIEFVKYANEGLVVAFLSVLDDLERSVNSASEKHQDYEAFLKGVEMIMVRIYEMLKKNDVKTIDAVGKKFDPHCHEILMQGESDEHEDGEVVEEFQKGYYLGDRVVRTSKVKVAVNNNEQ